MTTGLRPISQALIDDLLCAFSNGQIVRRFLTRRIFDQHQDLDRLVEAVKRHQPVYFFTGRGPSSPRLHLGHLLPLLFCKDLGHDCVPSPHRTVIQVSDDEKFVQHVDRPWDLVRHWADQNAQDIWSLGFDPATTTVFKNTDQIGRLYPTVLALSRLLQTSKVGATMGEAMTSTVGRLLYPAMQMAPCFPEAMGLHPDALCVVPCAVDQYPFFRLCRDLCEKLDRPKPVLVCISSYLPGVLKGGKMSSSVPASAIFLGDPPEVVHRKLVRAKSAGRPSSKQQRELGALDLHDDVAFQCLRHFEPDDRLLEDTKQAYLRGGLLSTDVKAMAGKVIVGLLNPTLVSPLTPPLTPSISDSAQCRQSS